MDETYDVIVLGTGLKECILSGILSCEGKKVLHMDRNTYYGGEISSITPIEKLFEMNSKPVPKNLGRGHDWNVDLKSKFLMAGGKLVQLLLASGVTNYLSFLCIDGSYILQKKKVHKLPSNTVEALKSGLLPLTQKNSFRKFLNWVMNLDLNESSTWKDVYPPPCDIKKDNIMKAFEYFDLSKDIQIFVGHAICLYQDDSYQHNSTAYDVLERMKVYYESVIRFEKSPYIYPCYGLCELPQSFARLSAVYGGTYMLNKPVDEIVLENGKVVGVRSGDEIAKCDMIICDPTYVPDRVVKAGQVVRAICILNHPISHVNNAASAQIIIPQSEVGRKYDMYVSCVSHPHKVCPKQFFVAHVATIAETDRPSEELKPGLDLLEPIEQIFYSVEEILVPTDDGQNSKLFISSSYDASTHFQSTCDDVLDLYKRITGQPFDFSKITKKLSPESAANQ